MILTTITIRYGRTVSLDNHSNVRPEVALTAELEEDDNLEGAKARLLQEAKAIVEEEIDLALEAEGRPAKFSTEQRYDVWRVASRHTWETGPITPPERLIIVAPVDVEMQLHPGRLNWPLKQTSGHRLAAALRIAGNQAAGEACRLISLAAGDLLPAWVLMPVPEPEPAPVAAGLPVFDEEHEYEGEDDE